MSKYIFATLLSTPNYLPGVKMLYRSLKYFGNTKYPFVVFCSSDLPELCMDELGRIGVKCIRLENSTLNEISKINNQRYTHWCYTFDKLLLWGMTMYEKIVFLDSDMIVLKNIDELFECQDMSAVQAGRFLFPDWVRLNSGCVVFSPSKTIFNKLLASIPLAIQERKVDGYDTGDQDVLNFYFRNWPYDESLHLDEMYNVFYTNLPKYKSVFGKSPKIIHFTGGWKPWMYRGFFLELQYVYSLIRYKNKRSCLFPYLYAKMLSM